MSEEVSSCNVPSAPPLPLLPKGKNVQNPKYQNQCMTKDDCYELVIKDVFEKCDIFNIFCSKDKVWMHPVPSILQVGPTCGLVAIAMFSKSIDRPLKVEDLLHICQANGFTKRGEMFFTKNMKALCDIVLGPNLVDVQHEMHSLEEDKDYIIQELKSGAVFLVAYDDERNFDPCLKNGVNAHWALIFGLIETDDNDPYLLARQGKSSHVGIWKFSSLSASNSNLHDVGRGRCNGEYVIPAEGIGTTLRNQYLLLRPATQG